MFARAAAVAHCARTRTCSVRMPRSSSHASNGPSTDPPNERARSSRSQTLGNASEPASASTPPTPPTPPPLASAVLVFRPTTAPATTSEWPFKYFVALCMTKSAPNVSGRHTNGVKTVASQHVTAPHARATAAAARISVTRQVGLDGVSIHSSLHLPSPAGSSARSTPRTAFSRSPLISQSYSTQSTPYRSHHSWKKTRTAK